MLNYKQSGTGFPVILLHGYMESLSMWDELIQSNNHFSWWSVDLPGHGNTPLVNEDMEPSIDWFAKQVIEFIDDCNIESFHIVGHSMGGYVAILIKKYFPDRCNKVVLLNSHPWEDSPLKKTDRLRVAEIAFKAKQLFIRQAIPALFYQAENYSNEIEQLIIEAEAMSSDAIAYAALAMRNRHDESQVMLDFKNDFLIIQGEHDGLIPCQTVAEWAEENKVPFTVLPNSGHMAHEEELERVSTLLMDFLCR